MNTNEVISYDLELSPNLEQISRMLDRAFKKYPNLSGRFSTLIRDGNTNIDILGTHLRDIELFSLCQEKETIIIIKEFRKNKMDAPCKIQESIHVFRLVNNMCLGKWGHITFGRDFFYY